MHSHDKSKKIIKRLVKKTLKEKRKELNTMDDHHKLRRLRKDKELIKQGAILRLQREQIRKGYQTWINETNKQTTNQTNQLSETA